MLEVIKPLVNSDAMIILIYIPIETSATSVMLSGETFMEEIEPLVTDGIWLENRVKSE